MPLSRSLSLALARTVSCSANQAPYEHIIKRYQFDDFALGQVRGLVEHEATLVDVGF